MPQVDWNLIIETIRAEKCVILLGPDFALIPRVRNVYRMQLLIKLSKKLAAQDVRQFIQDKVKAYYEAAPVKTLRITIDVDPA